MPAQKVKSAASGLIAYRDPITGEQRQPTEDELRRIGDASRGAAPEPEPDVTELIVHPDGSKTLRVKSGFWMSVVVRRNADGKVEQKCFDDPEAVSAFRAGGQPARTTAEK
ncbi:MAG: hypothetical protein JNK60_19650 [Acidobacteria bacterium]|nr:hypothetical protein [Acidobacteriota bacterium]